MLNELGTRLNHSPLRNADPHPASFDILTERLSTVDLSKVFVSFDSGEGHRRQATGVSSRSRGIAPVGLGSAVQQGAQCCDLKACPIFSNFRLPKKHE